MPITTAIRNRQLLSFSYDGFVRTVEPHCYGIDNNRHEALRAYQVGGGSESGEYVGWKLFHVSEMRGVTVLQEHFANPRPKYKKGDSAFSTIYAEL